MSSIQMVAAEPRRQAGRARTVVAASLAMLLVAVAAACVPPNPVPTPNPFGLRTVLGDGSIDLTWHEPAEGAPAGYDVQVLVGAGTGGWQNLGSTEETSSSFTDVSNRERYSFRVRSAAGAGEPAGLWSPPVATIYVDLLLPVLRIDTQGDAPILDKDNYVPGTVELDPNGTDFEPYSGTMGIRGRGNSTWTYIKKPYRMKLDTKSELMGMAAEKDWALLANYVDRSQLRNWAAMQASEATSLAYTPTIQHIEVVLNGQYQGVYTITQHNEIGEDRINITEMEDTDNSGVELTGGYRLEIDARLEENNEPGWRTPRGVPVVVKDPDPTTPQQSSYIRNLVNAFESSMFASNFADPVNGFRKYLDMENFIDNYLVLELTRNQDAFFSSTFFTKERGEDFFRFGPVWDFDNSMGNHLAVTDLPPEGWWARTRGPWMNRVFLDPTLHAEVAERWNDLKPAFEAIGDEMEALGNSLSPAIDNDAAKWRYERHETDAPAAVDDWLDARIAWLDAQFNPAP